MLFRHLLSIGLICTTAKALPAVRLPPPGPEINKYAVVGLPSVNFQIPDSWAGEVTIGSGYGNDSLFFWLWQAESETANENLIIWFNGGPACSSMLGIFKEHGPILFPGISQVPKANHYSWTRLANMLYVDQPVGTGFSQGNHPATGNTADTAAFVQWLGNFFNIFPALKSKRIHLLGESYAGIFIPYIAQAIQQQNHDLGINLISVGLGDATFGNGAAMTNVVATTYIKSNLAHYGTRMPQSILQVLQTADSDCGFTSLLDQVSYPPKGKYDVPGNPSNSNYKRSTTPSGYNATTCDFNGGTHTVDQVEFLINGTDVDTCFGQCDPFDAALNYFYDVPERCFNIYNIDSNCSNPYSDDAWQAYLNLPAVQKAIHVSPGTDFTQCNGTLFRELASPEQRSVPPEYFILPELLASGITVNIWAGGLDYLINHLGIELSIQNMTWNNAQGFQRKPSTKWYDADSQLAGIWHAERGLGYYLVEEAGHRTAQDQPAAAFTLVQHRVVGNNSLPCEK